MSQNHDQNPTLGALAWRICAHEKRAPVSVDRPEERSALRAALADGRLLEDDRGVRFADEHAMVLVATEHFLRTEADHLLSSPKVCFEQLDDIFGREIGKQHRISGCALAELHNTGRLDGFDWGRQAIEAGVGVFDVLYVMEGAVPLFKTGCARGIYDFFAGHHEHVKHDLAGGVLYVKLPPWFAELPDIARALKHMHEAFPSEQSASLYACALHGLILHRFDEGFAVALEAVGCSTPMVSGPALRMLRLIDYTDPSRFGALEEVIELCTGIIRTPGHAQIGTATGTLGRLISAAEKRIHPLLDEAAKTENPEVLYALSEALFQSQKELRDREWFWPLYLRLAAAKAEHKGTLDNVDMVLMGWLGHPKRQDQVLEFLNGWIARQPIDVIRDRAVEKLFDATIHHLKKQSALLNRAITEWLLHGDMRYSMVAFQVISKLREPVAKTIAFDPAIIDTLQPDEIRFLVRRILGFIVGDDAQIRLIFSLVRTHDATTRTLGLVNEVLRNHVGADYPKQTVDYLKERLTAESDEGVKSLCEEVIAEVENRLAVLVGLPWLKEFVPASPKAHRFAKERWKQMNKSFDEASKDSIWRQLATHVVVKAGRRTFQKIQGRYTEPTEMKSISHRIALPRSEISDPAGAALNRYLYKTATKDAP